MTLWQTSGICSNPGFLLEPRKKYLSELQGNLMQKSYLLDPTTWKVMQRNVWKDIANLRKKTTQQLYKVATPCMDDHQLKEEENESVGELSTICLQIALKCLYLARIGRPDISWSVNKLARGVTNGQKLVTNAWRIWSRTFITQVSTDNIVMWET